MGSKTSRYPLDYDELKRGDFIPPGRLEKLSGLKRGSEEYGLFVLDLGDQISTALSRRLGGFVTVVRREYGIAVLTPPEQNEHTQRRWAKHSRGLGKALREDLENEVAELDEADRRERDRRLLKSSWQLQQFRKPLPKKLLEAAIEGKT